MALFRNFYRCARFDCEWIDDWSAMCADDCPECGARHMSPFKSEDIEVEAATRLCLFHKIDYDGKGSGALVKLAYPETKMVGLDYADEFDMSLADGATVFVVDFCFEPHDRMAELQKHAKILFWLDHHKTAINGCLSLGLKFPGIQTVGKAAIELTWNFLHPDEPLPEIVRYIADHDLWQ
ncbi:MAG: hypothetical protein M3178_08900 [Pseudomonadota bacterium]|nr:hypothetical protein [Pseudomonadota bacterium]